MSMHVHHMAHRAMMMRADHGMVYIIGVTRCCGAKGADGEGNCKQDFFHKTPGMLLFNTTLFNGNHRNPQIHLIVMH
jgi:hypothetical protein